MKKSQAAQKSGSSILTTPIEDVRKSLGVGIWPSLNYLVRLKERMEAAGFPPDEPLYVKVVAAYNAVHALNVEVHYLSCDGAGRPSGEEGEVA